MNRIVVWEKTTVPGIKERTWKDKSGKDRKSYRVVVSNAIGSSKKQSTFTFRSWIKAKEWKAKQETVKANNAAGLPLKTPKELRAITLAIALRSYMEDVWGHRGLKIAGKAIAKAINPDCDLPESIKDGEIESNQTYYFALCRFQRCPYGSTLCAKSLYEVDNVLVWNKYEEYLRDLPGKQGEKLTPRTIKKLFTAIKPVFMRAKQGTLPPIFINLDETIIEIGEHTTLRNPLDNYRIKGSTQGTRKRSIEDDEQEKIEATFPHLNGRNKYYVPLAFYLAIETGMRLQEIMNLQWCDIWWERRIIDITKSKTDDKQTYDGRRIVLPLKCFLRFRITSFMVRGREGYSNSDYVFPRSRNGCDPRASFKQTWRNDVVIKSGIVKAYMEKHPKSRLKDAFLRFHDLRRTANTNFLLAGLGQEEREIMLGHANDSQNAAYLNPDIILKPIREKLDKLVLGDMTFDEWYDKHIEEFRKNTETI